MEVPLVVAIASPVIALVSASVSVWATVRTVRWRARPVLHVRWADVVRHSEGPHVSMTLTNYGSGDARKVEVSWGFEYLLGLPPTVEIAPGKSDYYSIPRDAETVRIQWVQAPTFRKVHTMEVPVQNVYARPPVVAEG